mmetsp:Transcript_63151/g.175092  ORF Transcript_63151/g.175092 Transcript_63151/m.175092 type:complete len:129 (+) Transcript_63151:73-459(+)
MAPREKRSVSPRAWTETVELKGVYKEEVLIHPETGPQVYHADGSYAPWRHPGRIFGSYDRAAECKKWADMTVTEQEIHKHMAAKKNIQMRQLKGEEFSAEAKVMSDKKIQAAQRELGVLLPPAPSAEG